MLCPRCHTVNRDNARFCKTCGMHFTAEQMAAAQPIAASQDEAGEQEQAALNASAPAQPLPSQAQPQVVDQNIQAQGDNAETDVSLAPTQILSPEEMIAYHSRLWQKEQEHEQADSTEAQNGMPASAVVNEASPPGEANAVNAGQAQPVASGSEPAHIPPPPPESLVSVTAADTHAPIGQNGPATGANSDSAAADASAPTVYAALRPEDGSQQETVYATQASQAQQVSPSAEQPVPDASQQETVYAAVPEDGSQQETVYAAPAPTSEQQAGGVGSSIPALDAGTMLNGRYEVTQVVSENEEERVYQVVDHQGYQHCWNCGSEQNAEGDEYCIDCGAALLNVTYTMHEYSAIAGQHDDAIVVPGAIVNAFVNDGKTYVIEQPQTTQIIFPTGVRLMVAGDSDAGTVRRGEPNEDSTLVMQLQRVHESISTPIGVFVVADGMGGHDNGQGASRMTINVIAERMANELLMKPLTAEKAGQPATPLSEDALVEVFKGSIEEANTSICQLNQHEKTDMGSTVTGFMIVNDHAYVINVGDSRTYMLRDGTLYQLTNDHSLVAQLLAGGLIEPDDVYTHPQRSQIFRSLGDKLNVQVDDFKQQVHPGDILLSCSDGLWEMVRNPQITDILSNASDPQTACSQLIEAANANGGEDNVSAVVVFVR